MSMKEPAHGIAIYGLPDTDLAPILQVAIRFFKSMGVKPRDVGYTSSFSKDRYGESIGLGDASLDGLSKTIEDGDVKDFTISYRARGAPHWSCSFSYKATYFLRRKNPSEYSHPLNSISIDYADKHLNISNSELVFELLSMLSSLFDICYGIVFQADGAPSAAGYVDATSYSSLFKNERPGLWQAQMPHRLNGERPAYISKLRMIYPYNIITDQHLSQLIDGMSLRAWIESDPLRGQLRKINNSTIWTVDADQLQEMNDICGRAGILICWEEEKPKPVRRLP